MEKHLLFLTVCTRVEPDVNTVTKALQLARNGQAKLWLLRADGQRRCLQGDVVLQLNPPDYTQAARDGLLYIELEPSAFPKRAPKLAFAPELDPETGLPVLMELYESAFVRRSYAGTAGTTQAAMPLTS